MWRFVKWILWIVVILIILFVLTAVALVYTVNPNDYKGKIEKVFAQSTGRVLSIPGKISWSLYPNIGFQLGKVSINNPKGYPSTPFASIQSAKVSIELFPLLSKDISINTVSLFGAHVNLVQLSQTRNNWTFGKQVSANNSKPVESSKSTVSTSKKESATPVAKEQSAHSISKFSMDKLDIQNATVSFDDKVTGQHYSVDLKSLTAKNVHQGQFFPVTLQTVVTQKSPVLTINVDLNGMIQVDQNSFNLKDFVAKINQSTIKGMLSVDDFNDPSIKLSVSLDQLNAAQYLNLKDTLMQLQGLNIAADIQSGPEDIDNKFKSLSITAKDLAYVKHAKRYEVRSFDLSGKDIGLNKAFPLQFKGIVTAPEALVPLTVDLNTNLLLNLDKQLLKLDNVDATINQSKLWGAASVKGFEKSQLKANFSLNQMEVCDFVNCHGAKLPMSGMKLSANLTTQGFTEKLLPSTLNGSFSADVQKTTLKGVDVGELLASLRNVIKSLIQKRNIAGAFASLQHTLPQFSGNTKQKKINPDNGKVTDIGRFILKAKITNGVVDTPDIQLTGARFRIKGAGQTDLNQKSLDYLFYAYGTTFVTKNGKEVEVDDPVQLPIKVKGPFSDVKSGIDMPQLSRSVQKAVAASVAGQIKDKVATEVQKHSKKLLEGLGGSLKGLFGK